MDIKVEVCDRCKTSQRPEYICPKCKKIVCWDCAYIGHIKGYSCACPFCSVWQPIENLKEYRAKKTKATKKEKGWFN